MADQVPPYLRSQIMAKVRSTGTKPETLVRRGLHRFGYRYRLHGRGLPGRPDIVFHGRRKAVFINGCFWHSHLGCSRARVPASNRDYWINKLERNRCRDVRNIEALNASGWETLVVWECELRELEPALLRIAQFLGPTKLT